MAVMAVTTMTISIAINIETTMMLITAIKSRRRSKCSGEDGAAARVATAATAAAERVSEGR